MGRDSIEVDITGSSKSALLQETQRVLGEQVKIVQDQQSQATKIIRVALTIGGLLLTGLSIYFSSPLFPGQEGSNIPELGTILILVLGVSGTYIITGTIIIFAKIFATSLMVLSPETGGIDILVDNPIATILSFYRQHLLPQPFSDVLLVNKSEQEEKMSLRPGLDSEEIQNILAEEESEEDIVERAISYNSGCIQGNEQLIEDNRQKLSEIYGLSVIGIAIITLLIIISGLYALIIMYPSNNFFVGLLFPH